MPIEVKFILFQLLIIVPIVSGFLLKNRFSDRSKFAKKLIRINLISIEPIIVLWSIWGLKFSIDLMVLPAGGLFLVLLGLFLGKTSLLFLNLQGKSKTTFNISSSLANHGFSLGGFICYFFIGEKGIGLSSIFLLYFMPYVFLFIFPYASMSGAETKYNIKLIKKIFLSFQNMPLFAIILALLLHFFNIKRPEFFVPIDILLLVSIGIYYFSLGINLDFYNIKSHKVEQFFLVIIKFLIIPAIVFVSLQFFNLDKSIKTVLLIQSFMPAAIYSIIASLLFDLDSKLASILFVVNTLIFLILILPFIFFLNQNGIL